MTTINLYQNSGENEKKLGFNSANKGFYFSISILLLTVLVYFGLSFYIPALQAESDALSADIVSENSKLVGLKNLANVADMQKRLSEIRNNLGIKDGKVSRTEMTSVLDKLSGDLGNGVLVDEYTFDSEKGVNAKFTANGFGDAARQISNFKNSTYFTGFELGGISRQESGISCEVSMNIK